MPQLLPAPWFLILFFTWAVILFLMPAKILSHTFSHEPLMSAYHKARVKTWNWTWQ